ncbi:MAG: hypothetical protein EPO39_18180 [Candidatus Manganitrophaceae bacterium]|nr:MAG: hypothetical protein EPO39_18180 [Candidatus Manganitrophaceae bacterium]
MSQVDLDRVISLLKEFAHQKKGRLRLILVGALALQYYGMRDRATIDLDAEVSGDLEGLFQFLRAHRIPADLGENISGWSVIAMPSGYRDRAVTLYQDAYLEVKALSPLDLIIAKLRRFTEEDIHDALFVVGKYGIRSDEIVRAAEEAIQNSAKDTALFLFRRNVELFVGKVKEK